LARGSWSHFDGRANFGPASFESESDKPTEQAEQVKSTIDLLGNLATQDSGQDPLEYAFVLGLMGLGAMVALKSLTNSVETDFNNIDSVLTPSV
jgi:hypothetical protein